VWDVCALRGWGIDLVGEDVVGESLANRSIQPSQQLGHGFAIVPSQHGHAVIFIVGHSHASDGANYANGDFPVLAQLRDIRKDKASTVELSPAVGFSTLRVRLRLARFR
jgi:hypothetical protein